VHSRHSGVIQVSGAVLGVQVWCSTGVRVVHVQCSTEVYDAVRHYWR